MPRRLHGTADAVEWENGNGGIFAIDVVHLPEVDGEIIGVMTLARYVSDRPRIERGRGRHRCLDSLEVAVMTTYIDGRVRQSNRQADYVWELAARTSSGGRSQH